jgi:hypothetical protein
MISTKNILNLEDNIKEVDKLLTLFAERVEGATEIIAVDSDPDDERVRILELISSQKKFLSYFDLTTTLVS